MCVTRWTRHGCVPAIVIGSGWVLLARPGEAATGGSLAAGAAALGPAAASRCSARPRVSQELSRQGCASVEAALRLLAPRSPFGKLHLYLA